MQQMNDFLRYIDDILVQNNLNPKEFKNLETIIYRELENYNVPKDEKQKDVSVLFSRWIERFKDIKNINVFNSEDWKYFCQFKNEKYPNQVIKECDPIKLYIPFDSEYLENSVNAIFDYCSKENIIHMSKVARKVRSDNLVIRVTNILDANKIILFVKNNLKEGRLKPNPFCFQINGVGLAIDNHNSYNDILSKLISSYLKYKNGRANINEFLEFINGLQTDDICIEEITKLIKLAITSNNNLQYFTNHFYTVSGNNKIDKLNIIEKTVMVTIKNHGVEFTKNSLKVFLTNGNVSGFSRFDEDNKIINYRQYLFDNVSKEEAFYLIKNLTNYDNINGMVEMYFISAILPQIEDKKSLIS